MSLPVRESIVVHLIVLLTICGGTATLRSAQRPQFASGTTRVLVDVVVTRKGTPVEGLSVSDFSLWDQGEIQQIELLERSAMPLNLVVLFDTTSHYARSGLDRLSEAVRELTRALRPEDRVSLLPFGGQPSPMGPLDRERLGGLRVLIGTGGPSSALNDALYAALLLTRREAGRSLIVAFSQGEDTASTLSTPALLDSGRRANAIVYGVVLHRSEVVDRLGWRRYLTRGPAAGLLGSESRYQKDDWTVPILAELSLDDQSGLPSLARLTGGGMVYADRVAGLSAWFSETVLTLRTRYLLAYRPTNRDPGWHEVSVRTRARGAQVSARPGYHVDR